ncbi:hypothetical protein B0H66DRAFT_256539 [Apodospora peruviana]|uniref:Uncharacterized protein n=1 Tax=Apodospora peruviana TaxID=516989 RepID=A0AAE0M4L9_9PEZI|nr:hypothetical protein B0H66DRAFT_256539 [Apodospora peruviana]
MAPISESGDNNMLSSDDYGHNPDSTKANSQGSSDSPGMWVTAVIVVGIVVIGGLVMFTILFFNKRNQYRKARQRDPYLSRGEFMKQRKMSAADRFQEEERQRITMIRKSLATRSLNSLESRSSRTNSLGQLQQESIEMDEEESGRLKDDWKEWEARMQRERALSGERHPAATLMADLPIPQQSRSRSPSRSPLMPPLSPKASQPGRLSPT